jgi:hypothetical protein
MPKQRPAAIFIQRNSFERTSEHAEPDVTDWHMNCLMQDPKGESQCGTGSTGTVHRWETSSLGNVAARIAF